ncbi:hypothetical protein APHAL10511_005501 [Amanita phalloides]|nr:hypothetical protein APHAL10511_005501 [Amanita phalloides]
MRQPGKVKRAFEAVKSFLLPTTTEKFQALERNVNSCYSQDIVTLEKDRDALRYLMLASRAKRVILLHELRDTLPLEPINMRYGKEIDGPNVSRSSLIGDIERISTLDTGVEPLTPIQEDLLKTYLRYVKTTLSLREHLDELNKSLEDFKYTVKTQAVAELTNYRGIHDWGETMRTYVSRYATGLGALSIAGAGLVYSTIFGNAGRGDPVGLMSLTFPLFTVGFLIPGFVHIGTCWAASMPKGLTFASQRFWTVAMIFSLLVASIMVIGAIVIVNITIFRLGRHQTDTKSWTLAEIAGIISLTFSGSIIVAAITAFVLGLLSRRMRTTVREHYKWASQTEHDALNTFSHV